MEIIKNPLDGTGVLLYSDYRTTVRIGQGEGERMFAGYHKKEFVKMVIGTIAMLAIGYTFTLGFFLLFKVS